MTSISAPPIILMAVNRDRDLARALEERGFVVITVPTGQWLVALAGGARPDVLLLEQQLPDMSGLDAVAAVRRGTDHPIHTPVFLLGGPEGTPVAEPSGGPIPAAEVLPGNLPVDELARRLEMSTHRARITPGPVDAIPAEPTVSATLQGPTFGWRARELGALMVRMHAAISCLVFSLDASVRDTETVSEVANAARTSDVVGPLGSSDIGVIAPVTGYTGAISFARRMSSMLRKRVEAVPNARHDLRVGFAAVDNLKYSPVDPLVLLGRAASAVNDGVPEPLWPWIRSADVGTGGGGMMLDWT